MRVFGNIMNRVEETIRPPTPEVGMGATLLFFSDRHAATVIEIVNSKTVVVQEDIATRTDKNGQSESQDYEFQPNPKGVKHTFTLRKNGTWVKLNQSMQSGVIVRLGNRNEYYDPSF